MKQLLPMTQEAVLNTAMQEIEQEQSGVQLGLKCRWEKINVAMMKYFRFGNIYVLAGASGSGKSYILNMLRTDFTDQVPMEIVAPPTSVISHITLNSEFKNIGGRFIRPALNADLDFVPLFVHFAFEMQPHRELIRTVSTMSGYSYSHILSSAGKRQEDGSYLFNKLTGDEKHVVRQIAEQFTKRGNVLTFPTTGNVDDLEYTIGEIARRYIDHRSPEEKPVKLIIAIDHSLLTERLSEKDDLELQNAVIKFCIKIRSRYDAMIILIAQMNSNIEDDKRRTTPALHYPTKKDLYMGGQLYQGADFIFTTLAPASLGIGNYGPYSYPTDRLIHFSIIKSRFDIPGQVWMREHLHKGRIVTAEWDKSEKQWREIPNL